MYTPYVEVQGSGPPLLLIPGGGGDAGMYAGVAPLLASDHTVVTYDRRGNSRSPLPSPDAPIDVTTQADDVIALLNQLDLEQAAVFGSSGGAIIVLDLLARYPDRLQSAIAHEPPLMSVLEPLSPEEAALKAIYRLSTKHGPMRAYAAMGAMTMTNPPQIFRSAPGQALIALASQIAVVGGRGWRFATRRSPSTMTRVLGNVDLLMNHELPQFCNYTVDIDTLRASRVPWATAAGLESSGRPYFRPAYALAERARVECVGFPGGHTVYMQDPPSFVKRLEQLLKDLKTCHEQD